MTGVQTCALPIFIAEGKLDFKSSSFDICKGQGLSRRRFADVVYLFFPKKSWDDLKEHDNDSCNEILEECKYFGLGLLLVDKDGCEMLINPEIESSSVTIDRKSTRLNSSHIPLSRMPSSA